MEISQESSPRGAVMERREDGRKLARANQQTFMSWPVDYVPAEQNLETIGYFSARYSRRALDNRQTSKLVMLSDNRRVEIVPSLKYGFPNAEDLDFYRAFLKICDERAQLVQVEYKGRFVYRPRLPSPIGFSTRELIAKAGRTKNGRGHIAVRTWIERLNSTTIHGELFDAKERKLDVRMGLEPLFRKYIHVGRPMADGEIAAQNFVWLADWFVENYFYLYSRPLDLKFHHRLTRSISKALYPLLDNGWFASNGSPYTKRYVDLCVLLDIQVYEQVSRVQQQLDPSNDELVREKFVASYDYPIDTSGKWTGTIRWWPGPKWIYDQEQKHKRQQFQRDEERRLILDGEGSDADQLVPPQLSLPLSRLDDRDPEELYAQRVKTFYSKLGQDRLSREKIRAAVRVLQNLVEEQQYSLDEIDFTLEWVVDNLQSKLGGRIQSLGILPHVISEALREKTTVERKRAKAQARTEIEQCADNRANERNQIEGRLTTLSVGEREQLRAAAVTRLLEQGVPKKFLLEGLIKMEMGRILAGEKGNSAG
jgi:hypothetical protein